MLPPRSYSLKSWRDEDEEKVFKKEKTVLSKVERSREYPRSHSVPVSPTRQKDTEPDDRLLNLRNLPPP